MIRNLDIASAIAYATDDVIGSFDFTKEYDIDELKESILTKINESIEEHNAICDKGNKWRCPDRLPNASIAKIILKTHIAKKITWNGKHDEFCYLCFYQSAGENKGLYTWDDTEFEKLVYRY